MQPYTGLVLAGRRGPTDAFAEAGHTRHRALIGPDLDIIVTDTSCG